MYLLAIIYSWSQPKLFTILIILDYFFLFDMR